MFSETIFFVDFKVAPNAFLFDFVIAEILLNLFSYVYRCVSAQLILKEIETIQADDVRKATIAHSGARDVETT